MAHEADRKWIVGAVAFLVGGLGGGVAAAAVVLWLGSQALTAIGQGPEVTAPVAPVVRGPRPRPRIRPVQDGPAPQGGAVPEPAEAPSAPAPVPPPPPAPAPAPAPAGPAAARAAAPAPARAAAPAPAPTPTPAAEAAASAEGAGTVQIVGDAPREAWLERGAQRAEVGRPVPAGGWTVIGRFDDGLPGFLAEVQVQPGGVVEVKCDGAFKRCRVL